MSASARAAVFDFHAEAHEEWTLGLGWTNPPIYDSGAHYALVDESATDGVMYVVGRAWAGWAQDYDPGEILHAYTAAKGNNTSTYSGVETWVNWHDGLTITGLDKVYTARMDFEVTAHYNSPYAAAGYVRFYSSVQGQTAGAQTFMSDSNFGIEGDASVQVDNNAHYFLGNYQGAAWSEFSIGPNSHFQGPGGEWSPYGSVRWDLTLEAEAASRSLYFPAVIDAGQSGGLVSVLLQNAAGDWVTPESLGFGVSFISGMPSPNAPANPAVPEPASVLIWSLLGAVGIALPSLRRSRQSLLRQIRPD